MIDLQKLRGRDAAELTDRLRQQLTKWSERAGWPVSAPEGSRLSLRLNPRFNAASWRDHWRTRSKPGFFAGFDDLDATAAEFRRRFGAGAVASVIDRAERIGWGQIDLLGLRGVEFGTPVDWHTEPLSGKRAGMAHWSRIDELDTSESGDKKIIWELNRCQHFVDLGRAYALTGDERFAETFAAQLTSWMDQNAPKFGVNWVSSLEVGLRAIAWLWALRFFRNSRALTPELLWRALGYLYVHGRHLEQYLSTYSSPNTHLTGEALGLFYLGITLPEFRRARRWRAAGLSILKTAIAAQVQADGVYFEQSTYYHRYTTDFYTHLLILSRRNGLKFDGAAKQRLASLFDHLLYIARPDGSTPLIGDDDGGRLLPLDQAPCDDFRAALSNGAVLFKRGELKFGAGELAEETLWLLGPAGAREFDRLPKATPGLNSHAFPDGGMYVMRDGWSPDATSLVIDCGPHGALSGGHGHADALSFDLSVRGRAVLVDPGTYTYTGSPALRDYFRSTTAHNTLTIDGRSSATPAGPFSWKATAQGMQTHWTNRDRCDFFAGWHDGYAKLASPALHTRSILFLHGDYLIVRDQVSTTGKHRYELNYHGAAGLACEPRTGGVTFLSTEGRTEPVMDLLTFGGGDRPGKWRIEDGFVSRCHQSREAAPVAVFAVAAAGSTGLVSFLFPRMADIGPYLVEEIAIEGGQGFTLSGENANDLLLLADGGSLRHRGLSSNFHWTWVRFAGDGRLIEAILLDGSDFRVDQEMLLDGGKRIDFARISCIGGQWVIETGDELITKPAGTAHLMGPSSPRAGADGEVNVRD